MILLLCLPVCSFTVSAKKNKLEKNLLSKDSLITSIHTDGIAVDSVKEKKVSQATEVVVKTPLNDISKDTALNKLVASKDTVYKPIPSKAVWYSALFPGLGQIYNRRYWKLPVIGAGIAGITYAIGWNNKYYVAYTNAYIDISDSDPNTDSYVKLLPNSSKNYSTANLTTILKNRQQKYRRSRDLSIIGAVGIYLICILDAYVDADLYDFDISPDLSLQPGIGTYGFGGARGFEMSLSFKY
jgi:hypothetical protein